MSLGMIESNWKKNWWKNQKKKAVLRDKKIIDFFFIELDGITFSYGYFLSDLTTENK